MAERTHLLNISAATLRFRDYTGTPLNHTPASFIPESIEPVFLRRRQIDAHMSMASSGRNLHAIIDAGESDEGSTVVVSCYVTDPKNTTDATTVEFFRGLYENNLSSKTGFSAWVTTPTLTGGSNKPQVKIEITVPDLGGTNHVETFAAIMIALESVKQGTSQIWNATFRIVGAITVS